MNALTSTDVLRPAGPAWKRLAFRGGMAALPFAFRLLRRFRPILRLGNMTIVSRYDDVQEVFRDDAAFPVPYKAKLDVIMGGQPFFLGMGDTAAYHADTAALRLVVRADDLPGLAERAETMAERIVADANGRLEVVDALIRTITFTVLGEYLGVPDPAGARLPVWGTRLFEFQFVDSGGDPGLRAEVDAIAPALRDHIEHEISRRRPLLGDRDDVLGRCILLQSQGSIWFDDDHIRTALMGLIVGGPPQPPMVVPQALNQLLSRPAALAGAQRAALDGDDDLLAGYVAEAMRFDPMAPGMPRTVARATTLAAGTRRQHDLPAGGSLLAASASAMFDDRRIPAPRTFDPRRRRHEYLHYGQGLHSCFGRHINEAILHLMLKPLLMRPNLRRARGAAGRLTKRGVFAEQLWVEYD